MLDQIRPIPSNEPVQYASVEEILAVQDLPERNVQIKNWTASGKALVLRVRGLDLPTQIRIIQASNVKNPKTNQWERDEVVFALETLQTIRVPAIDQGTARAMLKKNPNVIRALVDYIWLLAGLTDDQIESAAAALLPSNTDASEFSGDADRANNAALGATTGE